MEKKRYSILIIIISFILMAFFTISAGYYKKSVAIEQSSTFKIPIIGDGNTNEKYIDKTTVINIEQQGLVKKLVQPNVQTLQGTIINKGKEDLSLQLDYKGFNGEVIVSSSDNNFDSSSYKFNSVLKTDKSFKIKILLSEPRNKINQHEVSAGFINIVNLNNNKIIGSVPIKVINSSVQGPDNDNVEGSSCHWNLKNQIYF